MTRRGARTRMSSKTLEHVRAYWLELAVLPPAIARLADEVPVPLLASESHKRAVREYLEWWTGHANPTGRFAMRTRWLARLPSAIRIRLLFALGYDGLVYLDRDSPVGHIFFQRHGSTLHGFAVGVTDSLEGRGYAVPMTFDFVSYGATLPDITAVRVGRGQNPVTRRFLHRLRNYEHAFGWHVGEDGWVRFE